MKILSFTVLAKLLAATLLLVALRCLGEVPRLDTMRPELALTYAEARPFIIGALAACVALGLSLGAIQFGRPRGAALIAGLTLAGLFAYRIHGMA